MKKLENLTGTFTEFQQYVTQMRTTKNYGFITPCTLSIYFHIKKKNHQCNRFVIKVVSVPKSIYIFKGKWNGEGRKLYSRLDCNSCTSASRIQQLVIGLRVYDTWTNGFISYCSGHMRSYIVTKSRPVVDISTSDSDEY